MYSKEYFERYIISQDFIKKNGMFEEIDLTDLTDKMKSCTDFITVDSIATVEDNGIIGFPEDVITFTSSTGDQIGMKVNSGGNCISL